MKNLNFFVFIFCALIGTSATAQNLPAYLPANGLVAWYPFNGNANDESGNGNDGTVNGQEFVSDRFNNSNSALKFNIGNDHITIPNFQLNGQEFTLVQWLIDVDDQINHERLTTFSWDPNQGSFSSHLGSLNNLESYFGCVTGGYGIENTVNSNIAVSTLNWQQYVVLHGNGFVDLYLNGVLIDHQPIIHQLNNFIGNLYIGGDYQVDCNSLLDDIAIYNRALSQEEITALYTSTPVNGGGGNTSSNSVPPGIPYQAVVRNANGQVAANAAVTTKFTLHQNTTDGAVEYQETHALYTNAQGLVSAVIGQGTAVQNTFAAINWANTTKFLQVEVDLGNGYVDLGTQQLMSVPFALYAANGPVGPQGPAGPQGPTGADGVVGAQGVSVISITTSGSNFIITLSDGTTQTVPIPATGSSGSGSNSNTLIYTITGF